MIHVENVFACFAAPLIITLFLLKGEARRWNIFFIFGLVACLLSAYINNFLTVVTGYSLYESALELAPICEEAMKALPVLLYLAILAPSRADIMPACLASGLGFALLENGCYLAQHGSDDLFFVLIRGFSTGTMHMICSAVLGYGLILIYGKRHLAFTGAFAAYSSAAVYHSMYNHLVSTEDYKVVIGYLFPLLTAAAILFIMKWPWRWKESAD